MKKQEIQQSLTDKGVKFGASATVEDLKIIAKENGVDLINESKSNAVMVVAQTPMFEGGAPRAKGDEFEVTEARSKALGSRVKLAE